MPITPNFDISQTDNHVRVDIHVPHVRVSPESLHVVLSDNNTCLHFASPPYLLILTFQHAFEENAEDACATYDPLREHGRITLLLAKQEPGVFWEDLDMVGALMKPRANLNQFIQESSTDQQKSIWIKEVLEETTNEEEGNNDGMDEGPSLDAPTLASDGYGFGRIFSGVFRDLARDGLAKEMLEIPMNVIERTGKIDNPLSVLQMDGSDNDRNANSHSTPQEIRRGMESSKFSAERYLQDLDIQDDYLYQAAMGMIPHWREPSNLDGLQVEASSTPYFTPEETSQLASIPYPLLPSSLGDDERRLWLGILDLLFAYCYDHLLTDGEPTVESAWTVFILSCSLSWLESFDNDESVEDIVTQSIRRSLVYPYLRNIDFAVYVWKQISTYILKGGRRCVIRCLLQIRNVLDQSELYYLGNKLYIDPYLAWLQDSRRHETEDNYLKTLAQQIGNTISDFKSLKEKIGLGLSKIEMEAFQEAEVEAVSSTGSDSDSESSEGDSDSDESSEADDDEDVDGKTDDGIVEIRGASNDTPHSSDLLDIHLGKEGNQPSSLILDMDNLNLNTEERGAVANPGQSKPTTLIEEME